MNRLAIFFVGFLFLVGAWISYLGTTTPAVPAFVPPVSEAPPAGPIYTVELPQEEPVLPPGPHRESCQVSCSQCHSPRLLLTQPRLTEAQWKASVHKMVAVYGAPLTAEQERDIVTYLTAVHGPESVPADPR